MTFEVGRAPTEGADISPTTPLIVTYTAYRSFLTEVLLRKRNGTEVRYFYAHVLSPKSPHSF